VAKRKTRGKGAVSEREAREQQLYEDLKSLLEDLGWSVTLARTLDGPGGHCLVRGQRRCILQSRLGTAEKVDILVDALRREDLDGVFLRPELRELVHPGSLDAGGSLDAEGSLDGEGSDPESAHAAAPPEEEDGTAEAP